jgi:nucleoside-diphosphate-sugar epimerase
MGRGDLTPVFDDPRPGDVAQSLADISKARAELNYMPQVTLEQGLKITLKEARK